jgi:hypothetical protein
MRVLLGLLIVLFNALDNLTTFMSLSSPTPGFEVYEANPFARWLFESVGLAEGLLLEALITTAAVCFLVWAPRISPRVRLALLALLVVLPAWATVNNLEVMRSVGITLG